MGASDNNLTKHVHPMLDQYWGNDVDSLSFGQRDMAQWLERGALPMSLPVVRFRIPLGAGFSEKYNVYRLLILGTLLRCCVPWQGTSPSNASFDSGENEYLVGQRWQCVR